MLDEMQDADTQDAFGSINFPAILCGRVLFYYVCPVDSEIIIK